MNEVVLVGNNLAMMVAASELARRGKAVTLLTDGRPLGAHFAGMTVQGLDFDVGMVLLEQIAPTNPCDDLRQYRSAVRNDWTRFGHLASQWLQAQQTLRRVPTPECRVGGRVWPDYLIANRLEALAASPLPGPDACARTDPRHPLHKLGGTAYDNMSYAEAAQFNHGQPLHDTFIEPFVRKLLGVDSPAFLARFHRAAWVPLFYPETLRAAQRGQAVELPEYPFWTTGTGFTGQLVRDLRDALQASPRVTLRTEPLKALSAGTAGLHVGLEGGASLHSARAALGLPSDRCHALLGPTLPVPEGSGSPAASVSVAFARVRANAIGAPTSCQMVVDDDHAAYRLTDQDALAGLDTDWHRISIEASPARLAQQHPGLPPEQALAFELRSLLRVDGEQAVEVLKCITARNALVLPTAQAVAAADAAANVLDAALPGVAKTGNLLGYGVASLNDQLVQGLKIAEELS
ncbi:MAG TPA: hypothetical protein VEZ89_07385 [Rubrivivax sp.]|nr:hypothetical protein [Rubrivivax sp.]